MQGMPCVAGRCSGPTRVTRHLGIPPEIVSAISAGVAGYLEWSSVGRKVSRYNGSIVEIENLILWWDSMSTVEKGAPHSVNNLVAHGESIINGERGSWLAAPAKEGGEEGEGDKDDEKADKKDA